MLFFLVRVLPQACRKKRSIESKIETSYDKFYNKILGSVSQKGKSKKQTKKDSLGRHGVESLRGVASPLNPPLYLCIVNAFSFPYLAIWYLTYLLKIFRLTLNSSSGGGLKTQQKNFISKHLKEVKKRTNKSNTAA